MGSPLAEGQQWTVIHGDCLDVLPTLGDKSVDAVVTDPPYELGFMGKTWDASGIAYSVELWREVLRVLKPGGHLLAFGGTRTYHRMTCAIEDAGFEIRDSLHWMYGTGFPKSLTANTGMPEGQGTALKPAHEPIVLARKPLEGTVAANVQKWGTGGLNIDGCRIEGSKRTPGYAAPGAAMSGDSEWNARYGGGIRRESDQTLGRWPANVLLDESAAAELDAQSGTLKAGVAVRKNLTVSHFGGESKPLENMGYGGGGGASRFFYVSKPDRGQRNIGCDETGAAKNIHPTVKPVSLMQHLVRLVAPPCGVVLDPFLGSGSTGMAAILEGLCFVGVERDSQYADIARRRLERVRRAAAVTGDLDRIADIDPRQTSIFDAIGGNP